MDGSSMQRNARSEYGARKAKIKGGAMGKTAPQNEKNRRGKATAVLF
jgi:hypothetical protein